MLKRLANSSNLRVRFIFSFIIYAVLTAGIFAALLVSLQRSLAEDFFFRRIATELTYFEERYQRNSAIPLPADEDIVVFLGTADMPDFVRNRIEKMPDGSYFREVDPDDKAGRLKKKIERRRKYGISNDLFFGVRTLHDGKRLYILVNYDYWHEKEHELHMHTIWAYGMALLCAILLGIITANHVIKPLRRLMRVVESSDPDNVATGFSSAFRDDEFGALARALDGSLKRVKRFIKREHQFTRDASHELRTPVTVIKGAVELLKMSPACDEEIVEKLVRRIERSTLDMETTIESLLWLARESDSTKQVTAAEILALTEAAIDQNRHLIEGKPVDISLQVDEVPVVNAPAGVLAIAVSNLIRNACQFTVQGKIIVTLQKDRFVISDTGVGIAEKELKKITRPEYSGSGSSGFGFGLDIVSRLCHRFNWTLNIESRHEEGTIISMVFG